MTNDYIKPEIEEFRLDLETTVCLSGNYEYVPEEGGSVGGELPEGEKWD